MEKVNSFYVYKRTEMERRLRILSDKYQSLVQDPPLFSPGLGSSNTNGPALKVSLHEEDSHTGATHASSSAVYSGLGASDAVQGETLMSSLVETRQQMHKILKFAALNATGFRKILKKYASVQSTCLK